MILFIVKNVFNFGFCFCFVRQPFQQISSYPPSQQKDANLWVKYPHTQKSAEKAKKIEPKFHSFYYQHTLTPTLTRK
jgi:hypothetical protein